MAVLVFKRQSKGLIYGAVSAACWGTYGIFLALLTGMGLRQMTLVAIVPLVMMIYAYLKALANPQKVMHVKGKFLFYMALHGLVLINGGNYCYLKAVENLPVGIVSVISFCNVIIVMFASNIFFQYRLTAHKIGAVLGALIGIAMILGIFSSGQMVSTAGIGWAMVLPFCSGISVVTYRYYLNQKIHQDAIVFWVNFFAVVLIWLNTPPWLIYADIHQVMAVSSAPLGLFLLLAGFFLIPLAACNYAFFRAYLYIEPTYVSLCYALDPATAAIFGFFLFGQRLTAMQLAGIGVVVAAILYIKFKEASEESERHFEPVRH